MSLVVNILKVRKAFSDPKIPHGPSYSIAHFDLIPETGLNISEIKEVLGELEKAGVVRISPTFITVNGEYRELMGVSREAEEAKRQAVVARAINKLTREEREVLGVS